MNNRRFRAYWQVPMIILAIVYGYLYLFSNISELVVLHRDDAYYYYIISQNIAESGMISYDGIHLTNGFHPIWAGLLTIIAFLPIDNVTYLRVAGILSTILILAALYISFIHLNNHYSKGVVTASILPLLGSSMFFIRSGMEIVVAIPVGLLIILFISKYPLWDLSEESLSNKFLLSIGTLLAIFQLTRLDAVIFNILLVSVITLVNIKKISIKSIKRFVMFVTPIAISGFAYLSINLIHFNRLTPVSGAAKSVALPPFWIRVTQLPNAILELMTGGVVRLFHIGMILLCLSYITAYLIPFTREYILKQSLHRLSLVISIFYIIQFFISIYTWDFRTWYFYPSMFVGVTVVPLLLTLISKIMPDFGMLRENVNSLVIITIILSICMVIVIPFIIPAASGGISSDFRYMQYQEATELQNKLEEDAIIAMGDGAGSFSYFVDRPVIQLEGITNNDEYLEVLGEGGLRNYLCENEVDYVVASGTSERDGVIRVTRQNRWTQNLNYTVSESQIVYDKNKIIASVDCSPIN